MNRDPRIQIRKYIITLKLALKWNQIEIVGIEGDRTTNVDGGYHERYETNLDGTIRKRSHEIDEEEIRERYKRNGNDYDKDNNNK